MYLRAVSTKLSRWLQTGVKLFAEDMNRFGPMQCFTIAQNKIITKKIYPLKVFMKRVMSWNTYYLILNHISTNPYTKDKLFRWRLLSNKLLMTNKNQSLLNISLVIISATKFELAKEKRKIFVKPISASQALSGLD